MLVIGLTGGIGSGKSTVSRMLAERGAVVLDADAIVHEVQAPGGPAYDAVVERFGPAVVGPDGRLDRPALARIVFADRAALDDLNSITHPLVGARMAARLAEEAPTDHVVVLDVPLLVETGRGDLAGVVVVDCPEDVAVGRLVTQRGISEDEARLRMAAMWS